jgi:hypothetical protein
MIFKSASPISPDVSISIDKAIIDYVSLQRISLEQHENQHDMLVLDFSGLSPELVTSYIEQPITVTISYPNLKPAYFYGYITFIEPISVTKHGLVNGSPFQLVRMYCMGSSYVMKSKVSKAWENVTISDIALKIADTYDFSVSVPSDKYRFTRLAQTSESDWEFLVRVSKKLGYAVSLQGTHLHIWDSYKTLRREISYTTLETLKGLNGDVTPDLGQIIMFEAQYGAITPDATRAPDTIHVLDRGGRLVSISSSLSEETSGLGTPIQSIFSNTLNENADSYEMGQRLVSGALRNSFSVTAKVMITGLPILKPGSIVKINKYESDFDGYWYVQEVKHEVTKSELISYLKIATDSKPTQTLTTDVVRPYSEPPTPSLIQGKWVSSSNFVEIYE